MAEREEWIKNKKSNYHNSIAAITKEVLKPAIKSHSKVEAEIILSWNKIFSSGLGKIIEYKKSSKDRKTGNLKIYITTAPENSVEVSYKKDVLIEEVNFFFGRKVVDDIIIEKSN